VGGFQVCLICCVFVTGSGLIHIRKEMVSKGIFYGLCLAVLLF